MYLDFLRKNSKQQTSTTTPIRSWMTTARTLDTNFNDFYLFNYLRYIITMINKIQLPGHFLAAQYIGLQVNPDISRLIIPLIESPTVSTTVLFTLNKTMCRHTKIFIYPIVPVSLCLKTILQNCFQKLWGVYLKEKISEVFIINIIVTPRDIFVRLSRSGVAGDFLQSVIYSVNCFIDEYDTVM